MERTQLDIAGFKGGGSCHEQPLKAGKGKKMDFPLETAKENGALLTPCF